MENGGKNDSKDGNWDAITGKEQIMKVKLMSTTCKTHLWRV
jgi:hypothetical protein